MKSDVTLMTSGSIYPKIVRFALPVFWGQLFQQLYNIVDAAVVGNFVGLKALAAVSSTNSLTQLFVGLFVGIFIGASVVISKYLGAGREDCVHRAVHTDVAVAVAAGLFLAVIANVLAPKVLVLMDTPEGVLPDAVAYMRIYFSGALFVALFNCSSGIFQAVGDSRHPLYYLIFSSVLNVALDLLFVAVFEMGVKGAGIATVISQAAGAFLAFRRLCTSREIYRVEPRKLRFDPPMLREILRTGLPSGVQNCVISFANVIVQSNINAFGDVAMAGAGAFNKSEGIAFIPITSFAMASTTFIGQNLGAHEYERAKRGAWFSICAGCLIAETVGVIFYFIAPYLIALFNNEPEVIEIGTTVAHIRTLFFFLLAFSHCVAGVMRGAGRAIVPMLTMLGCWCVFRVSYISIATHYISDIRVEFWAYPITWTLSSIILLVYLLKSDWVHGLERGEKSTADYNHH